VVRYTLYPATPVEELAVHDTLTECDVAVTPVPLKAIAIGEPEPLLTRETLPVALPEVVGANFTWKVALCPAESVIGSVKPLML
jgi:hypothetical protein